MLKNKISSMENTNKEIEIKINLDKLDFGFSSKPLVIGGLAMEYYNLRGSGEDIDLVITNDDYVSLSAKYPNNTKDLWGDLGVCIYEFEIWRSICLFDYEFLSVGAIEFDKFLIISLEKLLFMKALAMGVEKYHKDLELIVDRIRYLQHKDLPT